jgi:uncharacterized glyoxalase superfamily protein PhnB
MSSFERVIPLLVYRDIAAAHDFLVQAFGFESGGVEWDAGGRAVHGEVRAGSTAIWLHRAAAEHELASPATADLTGAGLVIHVSDLDAHFARAQSAGARIQSEPTVRPYGQREYEARDPEGHRWWFATPLTASTLS